mmetsp:Transcript_31311/g.49061  ORF Transcript_31311/g.49061 Transcript_31311/m.49061 type:complete len:97 (-) Transcript_31311:202-492(-)
MELFSSQILHASQAVGLGVKHSFDTSETWREQFGIYERGARHPSMAFCGVGKIVVAFETSNLSSTPCNYPWTQGTCDVAIGHLDFEAIRVGQRFEL